MVRQRRLAGLRSARARNVLARAAGCGALVRREDDQEHDDDHGSDGVDGHALVHAISSAMGLAGGC